MERTHFVSNPVAVVGATWISLSLTNATHSPSGEMLTSSAGNSGVERTTHLGGEMYVVWGRSVPSPTTSVDWFIFATSTTYAASGCGTSNREGLVVALAQWYRVTPIPVCISPATLASPHFGRLEGSKHA
jgi:hypothetical protein